MPKAFLDEYIEKWKDDPEFRKEELILELNEQICELMEKKGINRTELADRIKVNRAFVTKILNGSQNLTIGTLVRIALALEADLKIDIIPKKINKSKPGTIGEKPKESVYLGRFNYRPSVIKCSLREAKDFESLKNFMTQMEVFPHEIVFGRSTASGVQTAFSPHRSK